jgi:type II secretory pathway component GspD/PulD (secretin)
MAQGLGRSVPAEPGLRREAFAPELRPTVSRMPIRPFVRSSSRITPASAVVLLLAMGLCPGYSQILSASVKPADAERAEQAYLQGARLLEKQDLAAAETEFARAAKLNPAQTEYGLAAKLTRDHQISELTQQAARARLLGRSLEADRLLAEARAVDPTNELVLEHAGDGQMSSLGEGPKVSFTPTHQVSFLPPIQIQPKPGPETIHARGNSQQVIAQAATQYGLKTVFDSSLTSEPGGLLRFDLEDSPYDRTMPLLFKMTHTFAVPLDRTTLLVAKDTQEERNRLERQVEESIYVPASTPEQLNELTNIIKNVFDVRQVAVAQESGTLLVRAPQPTLTAMNETLDDLIDGGSEVVVDLKLISIARTSTLNTGLQPPTSVGIFNAYAEASSIVSANQSLVSALLSSGGFVPTGNVVNDTILEALYLILSGAVSDSKLTGLIALIGHVPSATLTGVYLTSGATINFGLNTSDSRALDDLSVRVGDRQTTTLRVGEKYPITTATYSSGVSSSTASALAGVTINGQSASTLLNQYLGSAANQTIPQVQYEDLGITLKVTPTVLKSGMVDTKIDLKIEALEGASLDNIPVLTSEVFTSDITVPDGSSAVMLSQLSRTESASISGLPGISELPGFQQTAADDLRERDSSELVLLITPHVVRHRSDLTASRRIPFSTSVPQEY